MHSLSFWCHGKETDSDKAWHRGPQPPGSTVFPAHYISISPPLYAHEKNQHEEDLSLSMTHWSK